MWGYNQIRYGRDGRATPFPLWLAQRLSAVLLGPMIVIHILVPGAALSPWLGALILLMVLVHGTAGVWRLAAVPGVSRIGFRAASVAMIAVSASLTVIGAAIVLSIS